MHYISINISFFSNAHIICKQYNVYPSFISLIIALEHLYEVLHLIFFYLSLDDLLVQSFFFSLQVVVYSVTGANILQMSEGLMDIAGV